VAIYTSYVWPNLAAAASMRPNSPMIKAPHVWPSPTQLAVWPGGQTSK